MGGGYERSSAHFPKPDVVGGLRVWRRNVKSEGQATLGREDSPRGLLELRAECPFFPSLSKLEGHMPSLVVRRRPFSMRAFRSLFWRAAAVEKPRNLWQERRSTRSILASLAILRDC